MRVCAKAVVENEIPVLLEPFMRQRFLTPGREYEVHAVIVSDGISFLQFVDDLGYPAWQPSWVFAVTDARLPADWICNPISENDGHTFFLMGPEFIAKDEDAYARMVELYPDQVERFWKRVAHLERPDDQH